MKVTRKDVQYFNGNTSVKVPHEVTPGEWVHLAIVKREKTLTCYTNGDKVNTARVDFDMPELPFYLGGDPRANEFSQCSVDEVRLYQRALDPSEIKALSDKRSIPNDVWKYMPLEQPSDTE